MVILMKIDQQYLRFQRAGSEHLGDILRLLADDKLGQKRESLDPNTQNAYRLAFQRLLDNPMHAFMIVLFQDQVIGCCHLTLLHGLSFKASTRLQIESVRIDAQFRGQGIGHWMMKEVFKWGDQHDVQIFQLTTHKDRPEAKKFYASLGFVASHEGMKLLRPS